MMNLHTFVLLTAAAAAMTGCCRRTVEPRFAELELDTVVRCGVVPCDMSYRYLTIANAGDSEALAAIENANVNYFFALEDFTGPADEAARLFVERFIDDTALDTLFVPEMRYIANVSARQHAVDSLLVYTICREYFTGGAHRQVTAEYHNYWMKGGCELSLGDLFSEEQLPRITECITAKLCAQYGAADAEGLAQIGFFPEAIAPTENFEVTPDGVVFHYNPYDIACYAVGMIAVPVAMEELR